MPVRGDSAPSRAAVSVVPGAMSANVHAALLKSAHPGAIAAMKDIYMAEDIDKAQLAVKAFEIDYGAKYPTAVAKNVDDLDVLLEFYKYPAEHWIHLRTTNPIESTFASIRLRTEVTKGPGSRAAGIAMAYKAARSRPGPLAQGQRRCSTRASCSNDPTPSHRRRPTRPTPPERRSPENLPIHRI